MPDPRQFVRDPGDRFRIFHVGNEGEPVVVIDRASGAAEQIADHAATRSVFTPAAEVGSGYPGLLGPAPTSYVEWLVRTAIPLIERHFVEAPVAPVRARGNFSLVTTEPDQLLPEQRMPHVDTADRLQFAAVHFLARTGAEGTGFFRHRATGFETIDPDRLPRYRQALDAETPRIGTGYPRAGDALFELIAAVPAAFDRLVLYRAALLHSGMISRPPAGASDPRRGRLTGNLFLQCRPA